MPDQRVVRENDVTEHFVATEANTTFMMNEPKPHPVVATKDNRMTVRIGNSEL